MNQCAHMHTTMRVIRWRLATPRKQFLRGLIGPMEYIKLHQFLGGGKQNFWKELNAAAHWSSFRLPISIPPAFNQGLRADCPHWKPLHTISISDEWSPVFVFFLHAGLILKINRVTKLTNKTSEVMYCIRIVFSDEKCTE